MDENLLALIANGVNNGVVSGSGAGATSLASLLGAGDLNTFAQQAQANDILGQIAPVIASFRPDRTNWDLGTSFGTSLGQAFLAGALGNQSRANVAEQVKKVSSVLPSLYTDPLRTVAPEGIDATAWEGLKTAATVKNLQRQIGEQTKNNDLVRKLVEDVYGTDISAMKTGKETKAKINAENEAYGVTSDGKTQNPNSPQYKAGQDALTNERTLNNDFVKHPLVQDFKYKEEGLKALAEAFKDTSGTSDFEIIRRTAQAVEPGLAVRADDERSLQGAASLLGMSLQTVKSAATGDTKLTPEVRAGMLRIAKRAYDSTLSDYNTVRQNFIDRAVQGQLTPERVVPYGEGVTFEKLLPGLDISAGLSGVASLSAQQQIIQAVKAQYGNTPEAKLIAQEQIKALSIPRAAGGTPLG